MSMEIFDVPSRLLERLAVPYFEQEGIYRCYFNFHNLGHIVLVVYTISKHVSEVSKRSFQRISCSLLFRFFERGSLALAILDMSIANILSFLLVVNENRMKQDGLRGMSRPLMSRGQSQKAQG